MRISDWSSDVCSSDLEDARREQAARIRTDIAQWEALKRQVERDRHARLPLATDRSATALAAYRAGATIRPWLDARRAQLDLLIEHTQRLEALGRTWAALAHLLTEHSDERRLGQGEYIRVTYTGSTLHKQNKTLKTH